MFTGIGLEQIVHLLKPHQVVWLRIGDVLLYRRETELGGEEIGKVLVLGVPTSREKVLVRVVEVIQNAAGYTLPLGHQFEADSIHLFQFSLEIIMLQ